MDTPPHLPQNKNNNADTEKVCVSCGIPLPNAILTNPQCDACFIKSDNRAFLRGCLIWATVIGFVIWGAISFFSWLINWLYSLSISSNTAVFSIAGTLTILALICAGIGAVCDKHKHSGGTQAAMTIATALIAMAIIMCIKQFISWF